MMMNPRSSDDNDNKECVFCYFFTSQAGVVICVFQGFTLLAVTLFCNIFMENEEPETMLRACHWMSFFIFFAIMVGGYVCAIASAYTHKRSLAKIATYLLGCGTVYYLFLSVLSFLPVDEVIRAVCISNRCPDHHWIQEAGWRELEYTEGTTSSNRIFYVLGSFVFSIAILFAYIYTMFTFYGFMKFIDSQNE